MIFFNTAISYSPGAACLKMLLFIHAFKIDYLVI